MKEWESDGLWVLVPTVVSQFILSPKSNAFLTSRTRSLFITASAFDRHSSLQSMDFSPEQRKTETWRNTLMLAFQSLGVAFGYLSIGPLYVFSTAAPDGIKSDEMLYGLMSFIFWTMMLIPLLKYVYIVLMADDNGEGGIFALYSLLCRHSKVGLLPNNQTDDELCFYKDGGEAKDKNEVEKNSKSRYLMWLMAMVGSCTVIGCGVLVPTISVRLAALNLDRSLEELFFKSSRRRDKFGHRTEIPIAYAIIIALFMLQHYGTHKIGFLFAPIISVWLLFIGGLGAYNILHWDRHIIAALSPQYMYKFIVNLDIVHWRSLGGVLLCTAGSEAIFADLGHFSKKSIKIAFSLFVYPSLILCYMGQAAYISKNWNKMDIDNVTHLRASVPGRLRHVFPWLSLLASAVGSQAAITATFSIIKQCLALDCLPRMKVVHTSEKIHGQVYIPDVNWILMVLCLAFTFAFRSTSHIGFAIALAIVIGMLITTCFMSLIIALYRSKMLLGAFFLIFFGSIEAIYFLASVLNIENGAWILAVFVEILLLVMLSWHYGVTRKYQFDMQNKVPIEWLASLGPSLGVARVPGIAFICTDITKGIPAFFSHFVTNLPAFHQVLIFVSFKSLPIPQVPQGMQLLIGRMGPKEYKVYRCIVRYGYRDTIGDVNEFEDQIIHGIGEFISQDNGSPEASCSWSPEDRMVVSANLHAGNALITVPSDDARAICGGSDDVEYQKTRSTKRVQFMLPVESPKMSLAVRDELQELLDAREQGTTYILGRSQFFARRGANVLRRIIIGVYIFLVKNCREPSMVIHIPHAAHVEVCMSYTI